jgi:hypothetical protein
MLKLDIQIKEDGESMNINLLDPTKKQLDSASENERILAQLIKNVLDTKLLEMLEEQTKEKNN